MHGERFMAILTYFVSYRAETVRLDTETEREESEF